MPKTPPRLLPTALSTALATASLLAAATLCPAPAVAAGARESVVTALDYNATGWRYLQVPPSGDAPRFYERGYDDSGWAVGQAGFGSPSGQCPWNRPATVKTGWAVNTELLARHWIHLPRDAQEVRIQGTVDNDAQVYMNGTLLQTVASGNCKAGAIDVVVPASALECCNLLAIRARDRGGWAYLNVKVTYVKP
ncbi:hypothetical protein [Nonomuraea pusilla]|uniref:Uncharacterized protein n=1 Tax=Nonomuraea pusilla TaxID=46177 RepID=A0A1H8FW27_9ACTN|nr:hypothetical protein [Nonomuraea pusilla]SEN35745.1 hypothetical protein SAMN05660976_07373 [Nonomuraea pusilla]